NRQVRHQGEFLEDADDPGGNGVGRVGKAAGIALDAERSRAWADDARHDLDERRFARAVLAEHGMDRAPAAGEIDFLERADAGIEFRDAGKLDKGSVGENCAHIHWSLRVATRLRRARKPGAARNMKDMRRRTNRRRMPTSG